MRIGVLFGDGRGGIVIENTLRRRVRYKFRRRSMSEALITSAHSTLEECEAEMEQCRDNIRRDFRRFGELLDWILDTKLYLTRDPTLTVDAYCKRRWGFGESRAYQIVRASRRVVEISCTEVQEFSTVQNEWQARHLPHLPRETPREFLNNEATWEYSYKYTPESELTPEVREIRDDARERAYNPPPVYAPPSLPHVSHNSGNNEWYTPVEYIEAARTVMGGIDFDPASSAIANEVVQAEVYFTAEDDGLSHEWAGRVWMNPPYAGELIGKFTSKLCSHFSAGEVTEAIVLVNNATETGWFQEMAAQGPSICFPRGGVKFWHPEKESAPLQGQAVLYFGNNSLGFFYAFERFGFVRH